MRSEIFGVTISAINETLPSISLFKEGDCFAIARIYGYRFLMGYLPPSFL
jgi:hypothetical protein